MATPPNAFVECLVFLLIAGPFLCVAALVWLVVAFLKDLADGDD